MGDLSLKAIDGSGTTSDPLPDDEGYPQQEHEARTIGPAHIACSRLSLSRTSQGSPGDPRHCFAQISDRRASKRLLLASARLPKRSTLSLDQHRILDTETRPKSGKTGHSFAEAYCGWVEGSHRMGMQYRKRHTVIVEDVKASVSLDSSGCRLIRVDARS